ncbi:hypothetical protein [Dyella japonica]|uniref:Uncharacterized protein n=1 Tax=Dyella japonica DSM 16301 TaxID=1440762 RepID=A0A0G9H2V2_9GAMM|nr:hypothetical protein [Dyella japonica]KLD63539.1 hypothetical protein Y882_11255 [Dyella japonica DSM 16301]
MNRRRHSRTRVHLSLRGAEIAPAMAFAKTSLHSGKIITMHRRAHRISHLAIRHAMLDQRTNEN